MPAMKDINNGLRGAGVAAHQLGKGCKDISKQSDIHHSKMMDVTYYYERYSRQLPVFLREDVQARSDPAVIRKSLKAHARLYRP